MQRVELLYNANADAVQLSAVAPSGKGRDARVALKLRAFHGMWLSSMLDEECSDEKPSDEVMQAVVEEECRVLDRVQRALAANATRRPSSAIDYETQLLSLRDQIKEARLEDIPPLVEEMARLQQLANRPVAKNDGNLNRKSPYFGRLLLAQAENAAQESRKREVLIGRGTFLDARTGIRIVDWRDAPVSRVYYRYEEGDEYEEVFGGREARGRVVKRRSLGIAQSLLRRIGSLEGSFYCDAAGHWHRQAQQDFSLHGGQGTALRPESHRRLPGSKAPRLGGDGLSNSREDKHLAEITALIDARQFELITQPSSGLVVIQGGAGSGKTTIGLHRIAYLAFQDAKRFRSQDMLIVVFNKALARYIDQVLPALGVEEVPVWSYCDWASRQRILHLRVGALAYADDTPSSVVRFKKHAAMLHMIDDFAKAWRFPKDGDRDDKDALFDAWAEMLTDRQLIAAAMQRWAPQDFDDSELRQVQQWCAVRCMQVLAWRDERRERQQDSEWSSHADEDSEGPVGADGISEEAAACLDREDDALLLRLWQKLIGPLRKHRSPLAYEHLFVDETQDLSPLELAVLIDTTSAARSITLAGDVAQRLLMDNDFGDWRSVLQHLDLAHVQIEPLHLSYRSTRPIIAFAHAVLGPLAPLAPPQAQRDGAPVQLFSFFHVGEAVAFLSTALRDLMRREPKASVAVIARYAEQADAAYQGLVAGEVPFLRRIADQDFSFRAGIDVTDVRQVKGLEFDYVVLLDASRASYPDDNESRHLLHIASTRAIVQLWLTCIGEPSPLLPAALRDQGMADAAANG